jgi:ankyrin repeat protein
MINDLRLNVNELTSTGESPLLLLCMSEQPDVEKASLLLRLGANVNHANPDGWTPLHAAFNDSKKSTTIDLLLSHGANINAQDKLGLTPLMLGVMCGCSCNWSNVFKQKIDFSLSDKPLKRTVLHFLAGLTNCHEILQELRYHPDYQNGKIDVNCRDLAGFAPLHVAARRGNILFIKMLLNDRVDVNATTNTLKLTPAMNLLSFLASNSPTSRFIRNYDTLSDSNDVNQLIQLENCNFATLNRPAWWHKNQEFSSDDEKPLLISTVDEILTRLLEHTDLTLTDHLGNNILHHIVHRQKNVFMCVKTFPKLAELWTIPNKRGTTPGHLLISSLNAEKEFTTLIRELGPSLALAMNSEDEFGITGLQRIIQSQIPYAHASLLCNIEGLDWSKVKIKAKKTSLIHEIIDNNLLDTKIIENIARANPEKVNKKVYGLTPLAFYLLEKVLKGVQYPNKRELNFSVAHWRVMIDCLLNLPGVDIDTQDNDGNTPLHHACYYFHLGALDTINGWLQNFNRSVRYCYIAFKLVAAGARTDIKNNEDRTALEVQPHLMDYYNEYWPYLEKLIAEKHKITATKFKKK